MLFLLNPQNISNYSKLKIIVIPIAILTLLVALTSCSNGLFNPESPEFETTTLYKTHLDSEIDSIEKYIVRKNIDDEIEIPISFITGWSLNHVIYLIDGDEEYWLDRKVVDILSMNGDIAIVTGVEEGMVLLINPLPTMRGLANIDSDNLRYKFDMGREYSRK